MPDSFEIRDYIKGTSINSYVRLYYRKGKFFYLKRGDCVNHIWYPVRRISKHEYCNAFLEYVLVLRS